MNDGCEVILQKHHIKKEEKCENTKNIFHENMIMFCQHWWQFTDRTDYPRFKGHKGDGDVLGSQAGAALRERSVP